MCTFNKTLTAPLGVVRVLLTVDVYFQKPLSGVLHADSWCMKELFSPTLFRILFGGGKKVRVDPDHLPGLSAPTRMPAWAHANVSNESPGLGDDAIEFTYQEFKAMHPKGAGKQARDRGLSF